MVYESRVSADLVELVLKNPGGNMYVDWLKFEHDPHYVDTTPSGIERALSVCDLNVFSI
jgi:hypothetical protein